MFARAKPTLHLISPRGFCAGVDRAIAIVENCIELYGVPLYVRHEIVHNKYIVENFKRQGVVFIDELEEVPHNATVVFSAHGVAPQVVEQAKQRRLKIIDATCPLVTKVHVEAKRYAREDYHILLIGHKNHVETIGTYGEAPGQITVIENVQAAHEVEVPAGKKIAYLTQTTLSLRDTSEIIAVLKQRFAGIEAPAKSDICYATTNRQEAVLTVLPQLDFLLVVGAQNSSNSNRLRELAEEFKVPARLIDSVDDLNDFDFEGFSNIGLTSGASAPEILVQQASEFLLSKYPSMQLQEHTLKEENIRFSLPKEATLV